MTDRRIEAAAKAHYEASSGDKWLAAHPWPDLLAPETAEDHRARMAVALDAAGLGEQQLREALWEALRDHDIDTSAVADSFIKELGEAVA